MFELPSKKGKVEEILQRAKDSHKAKVAELEWEIKERGGESRELETDRYKQEIKILIETIDLTKQEKLKKEISKWQEEYVLLDKQHKTNKRKVTLDLAQAREELKEGQEQLTQAEETAVEARGEVLILKEMIRTLQNQVKQKDKSEAQMRKKLDLRENFQDFD